MKPEEQQIYDEIQDKILKRGRRLNGFNSQPHVIVVDYSTWQRLKNIKECYAPHIRISTPENEPHRREREEEFMGIPLAVKNNKKEKEISVY